MTLACRAAPFLLFSSGKIPPFLDYLQRYLPPMVMTVLVFNAFVPLLPLPASGAALPSASAASSLLLPGATAALLQFWKRNALLSIAGATALHMILARLG